MLVQIESVQLIGSVQQLVRLLYMLLLIIILLGYHS
jgi:hypothetical protein